MSPPGKKSKVFRPNSKPQAMAFSSPADVVFYGGAAGGGKSEYLYRDPARWFHKPMFTGAIFRRTTKMIKGQGGLWDKSLSVYTLMGGKPQSVELKWRFPSGATFQFNHCQLERDKYNYHGHEFAYIGFDEVTQFTKSQFLYLIGRNRSVCGIDPYIRATMNPDPDSWVKHDFILWYLDEEGRYPDPKKAGKIRYFLTIEDEIHWGNTRKELLDKFGKDQADFILSFTFIPASLEDNVTLMKLDPKYKGKLNALDNVSKQRLLKSDWLIKEESGEVFRKSMFCEVDAVPKLIKRVRWWDRAATKVSPKNKNPDFTASVEWGLGTDGLIYITDLFHMRDEAHEVDTAIKVLASQDDKKEVTQGAFQDPGGAGKGEIQAFIRMLKGHQTAFTKIDDNKVVAARPLAAQVQAGNVRVLSSIPSEYKKEFYSQMQNFPSKEAKKDYVDAASGGFNWLFNRKRPKVS